MLHPIEVTSPPVGNGEDHLSYVTSHLVQISAVACGEGDNATFLAKGCSIAGKHAVGRIKSYLNVVL